MDNDHIGLQADCGDGVRLTKANCRFGLPVRAATDLTPVNPGRPIVFAGTVGKVAKVYTTPHVGFLSVTWTGGQESNHKIVDNIVICRH